MSAYYDNFIKAYPMYQNDTMIKKAFDVAETAHEGQLRNSGDPYIVHPVSVANILADLKLDATSICAGLLHDVPEDTDYSLQEVSDNFSPEIAAIVDGVTKLTMFDFKSKEEAQAENMRKMFLAMAADIRVVIIKLADRLHNMRTLDYKSEQKQQEKARETLEIYAPLAHRLGIYTFKWEFEDLSLKYLEPEAYFEIANKLKETRSERQKYIDDIIELVKEKIAPLEIHYEIEGRPKHIYSIYKKIHDKMTSFEELYDVVAVRVIVDTVADCYAVLGTVHAVWRPLPMRFKDYIAVPKANMYQSLHTTLLGSDGRPFEMQIRTFEMHATAEYGIAAHWSYKEGNSGKTTSFDNKLGWLREMMEWEDDLKKDSKEFMEAMRINFFSDTVFVFTPKGDVKELPAGSTPLDFAYNVHSDVGNKCVGAKINGRIVPLTYTLKTGDIVEILTNPNSKGPSRDWLSIVKTATARSKIRAWFKKELKEDNVEKGKDILEKEAKRRGYTLSELLKPEWLKAVYKRFTLNSLEDMYAAVGYGGLGVNQVLSRLIESYRKENKLEAEIRQNRIHLAKQKPNESGVYVKGYSDMVVRLAKCCNPLPGDDIIGFITRGRGVSVHRVDCSNINTADFPEDRRIEVSWIQKERAKYGVEIQIECEDRPGLVADITQLLYALGYSLISVNARSAKNSLFIINMKVEIGAIEDLEHLMAKIRQIGSVDSVFRVNN